MPLISTPVMLVQMPGGDFKEFPLVKHKYFKGSHNGPNYISGLNLPAPGQYYFEECTFHPGLKEELEKNYDGSCFVDCELPWMD